MTRDVSSTPRVGSVIDVRVDYGIQVCTKTVGIDARCASCCVGDNGPRHKAAPPNRPQFPDRRAVAGHDDRSPRLHLPKYSGRLIAKLPLGDYSALHVRMVAVVALRSNPLAEARPNGAALSLGSIRALEKRVRARP